MALPSASPGRCQRREAPHESVTVLEYQACSAGRWRGQKLANPVAQTPADPGRLEWRLVVLEDPRMSSSGGPPTDCVSHLFRIRLSKPRFSLLCFTNCLPYVASLWPLTMIVGLFCEPKRPPRPCSVSTDSSASSQCWRAPWASSAPHAIHSAASAVRGRGGWAASTGSIADRCIAHRELSLPCFDVPPRKAGAPRSGLSAASPRCSSCASAYADATWRRSVAHAAAMHVAHACVNTAWRG